MPNNSQVAISMLQISEAGAKHFGTEPNPGVRKTLQQRSKRKWNEKYRAAIRCLIQAAVVFPMGRLFSFIRHGHARKIDGKMDLGLFWGWA